MFLTVAEFHQTFGLLIADAPHLPDRRQRDLRIRLLTEEVEEFLVAFHAEDRIGSAKELADVGYILAGTAVAYGIAGQAAVWSPFSGWRAIDMFRFLTIDQALRKSFDYYLNIEATDDAAAIRHAINLMLWDVWVIAWQMNIPFNAVFAEVHRSNMTKRLGLSATSLRADGKVLKGPMYEPPRLTEIVNG